jgi:hypothetical protein
VNPEEVTGEMRKYFEQRENETIAYQNLRHSNKLVLKGRFMAMQ